MSQYDFPTIVPTTDTGTDLSNYLNSWADALETCHRGAARPGYAQAGMIWIDTSTAGSDIVTYFDGTNDVPLFEVDTTSGQVGVIGSGGFIQFQGNINPTLVAPASPKAGDKYRVSVGGGPTHSSFNGLYGTTPYLQVGNMILFDGTQWVRDDRGAHLFENIALISTDANLTPNAINIHHLVTVGGLTVTMPPMTNVRNGSIVFIQARYAVTLNCEGASLFQINAVGGAQNVPSLTVPTGHTAIFSAYAGANWLLCGGTLLNTLHNNALPSVGVDNQIVRFDGTTGKLQGSAAYINDSGLIDTYNASAANAGLRAYNGFGGFYWLVTGAGDTYLQTLNNSGAFLRNAITIAKQGAIDLYYNATLMFRLAATGVNVYGDTGGANYQRLLNGGAFNYHDFINQNGGLQLFNAGSYTQWRQLSAAGAYEKVFFQVNRNGGMYIYSNGDMALEIGASSRITARLNMGVDIAGSGINYLFAKNDVCTAGLRAGVGSIYLSSAPGNYTWNYNYLQGNLADGATNINFGNLVKLTTDANGFYSNGPGGIGLGNNYVRLWSDATNSQVFIKNTVSMAALSMIGTSFYIRQHSAAGVLEKEWAIFHRNDWAGLFFNGLLKFRTDGGGTYTDGKGYSSQVSAANFTALDEYVTKRYVDTYATSAGGSQSSVYGYSLGHRYMPGGTLVQWTFVATTTGNFSQSFPVAFSAGCVPNVTITPVTIGQAYFASVLSVSTTTVTGKAANYQNAATPDGTILFIHALGW